MTDSSKSVLEEILVWSESRVGWQRDALRRLLITGDLEEKDLDELTLICKSAHGLAEKRKPVPLEQHHLQKRGSDHKGVAIDALIHHGGVNALAKDQKLEFGKGLTIVYGDNAAGKSGYARILKRSCRARGAEDILGNVLETSAPVRPSATIKFTANGSSQEFLWKDQSETPEELGYVSVFDSHCAAVYVNEKTDVAFRPFGLDLFDKLSDTCEELRRRLEKEKRELESRQFVFPSLPENTAVYELISGITSLTTEEEVRKLGTLSPDEKERLKDVRKQLSDLQRDDPIKTSQALTLKARRAQDLGKHLQQVSEKLADSVIELAFESKQVLEKAIRAVEDLQKTTFPTQLLSGTGSHTWQALWKAAREFSTEKAYPGQPFPFTELEARCVLCQQDLSDEASERLKGFEDFVRSTLQQELEAARQVHKEREDPIRNLIISGEVQQEGIKELEIESAEVAQAVRISFEQLEKRRVLVLEALDKNQKASKGVPGSDTPASQVFKIAKDLSERAQQVRINADEKAQKALEDERNGLEAREVLSRNLSSVFDEIERKKKIAAYQNCFNDTGTSSITRKSGEVTKAAVTERLASSFNDELQRLHFRHLEVELQVAGAARGSLYHKLTLKRASGADLPRVVSEGEARTLAIAAFFAEISTAENQSSILFDDPVSSLDHRWRENVAQRLAEESRKRQVIVFTHDIVFLLALVKTAEEIGGECKHQYVRADAQGAGISSPELPWLAMKVKDRIGVLKNLHQAAEKVLREGGRQEYEEKAIYTYGRLRETWERALEEVLMGGIVERYRQSVQTLHVRILADISEDDCKALESGMAKCSRWLPGHDQAPAENVKVPEPDELLEDIKSLEEWAKEIRKRRQK